MVRGYTTPIAVAARLGATFTTEQTAACDGLIEALEAHLDHTIRDRWLNAAATTITHVAPLYGPTLALPVAPLAAVTSVTVSGPRVSSGPVVLQAGVGYAIQDAETATLTLAGSGYPVPFPTRVSVVYTLPTGAPVPADVFEACTRTVAAWLAPTLPSAALSEAGGAIAAAASGVRSYTVGQELRVEYADRSSSSGSSSSGGAGATPPPAIPPEAAALLAPYGYPPVSTGVFA